MVGYLGSYQHQIDEKGRLSLPAQFRRDNPEQALVLVKVFPDSLTLYPERTWAEVQERLREAMRRNPEVRPYALSVTANAVEVAPDKQGRILVPQRLQDAVGITGPTLIVGALDRIELWNPDRFAAAVAEPVPGAERFTHQIFG
jgi:MraZ protein